MEDLDRQLGQALHASAVSTVTEVRNDAEKQIEDFKANHFGHYVASLARLFSNPGNDTTIRRASSLSLKNALESKDDNQRVLNAQRWLALPAEVRAEIKSSLMKVFSTEEDMNLISDLAQCIGYIGTTEIPVKQWDDLVVTLLALTDMNRKGVTQRDVASGIKAIGYLCYQLKKENLQKHLQTQYASILKNTMDAVASKNQELMLEGMRTFQSSVEFYHDIFTTDEYRDWIVQTLLSTITEYMQPDLQELTLETLAQVYTQYYENMTPTDVERTYNVTSVIITDENNAFDEAVRKQAIEVWCAICEEESHLAEDDDPKTRQMVQERNYAGKVIPALHDSLCKLLVTQHDDIDDTEWNLRTSASVGLKWFAIAVGDPIIQLVFPFVQANIENKDWKLREAAISAFNACLDGPQLMEIAKIANHAFQFLVHLMQNDPNACVRANAVFAVGEVYNAIIGATTEEEMTIVMNFTDDKYIMPLMEVYKKLLQAGDETPVIRDICFALEYISKAAQMRQQVHPNEQSKITPHFEALIQALIGITSRGVSQGESTELINSAVEALVVLCETGPEECKHLIYQLAQHSTERLGTALKHLSENRIHPTVYRDQQTWWSSVLEQTIKRLRKEEAAEIINSIFQVVDTTMSASDADKTDPVYILIAMIGMLGPDMAPYANNFVPKLYGLMANHADFVLCSSVLTATTKFANEMGQAFDPFTEQLLGICQQLLRDPLLNRELRPEIVAVFGDVAMALGLSYARFHGATLDLFEHETQLTFQMIPDTMSMSDFMARNKMWMTLVEAYQMLCYSFEESPQQIAVIEQKALSSMINIVFTVMQLAVNNDVYVDEYLIEKTFNLFVDITLKFFNKGVVHYVRQTAGMKQVAHDMCEKVNRECHNWYMGEDQPERALMLRKFAAKIKKTL